MAVRQARRAGAVARRWTGPGRRAAWRRRVLRRSAAALLAGLAGFLLLAEFLPRPRVAAVVAARTLTGGAVVTRADVTTRLVPSDLGAVAARSLGEVLGRRLAVGAAPGEPLTESRLVPRSGDPSLPAGTVPVHVRAGDPAGLDLVTPGDRVSVHALTAPGSTVADAAPVLAVDPAPPDSPLGGMGAAGQRGVVLALTPAQATQLLRSAPDPLAPVSAHLILAPSG